MWFIEKCRHLEVEKLGLVKRGRELEEANAQLHEAGKRTAAGNKALKALSADLAAKLSDATAQANDFREQVSHDAAAVAACSCGGWGAFPFGLRVHLEHSVAGPSCVTVRQPAGASPAPKGGIGG